MGLSHCGCRAEPLLAFACQAEPLLAFALADLPLPPPCPHLSPFLPLVSGVQLESRAQGGDPVPGESWAGSVSTKDSPL